MSTHELTVLPGELSVCRLDADDPVPDWARGQPLTSITRTADELSVVCPSGDVPDEIERAGPFRALRVMGPLDFALVGVLAGLTTVLADARVSVFTLSTHDTDWLLVPSERLADALEALRGAGHRVREG